MEEIIKEILKDIMSNVTPESVHRYLLKNGWIMTAKMNRYYKFEFKQLNTKKIKIMLPLKKNYVDFIRCIIDIIGYINLIEKRPYGCIIKDLEDINEK